MEKRALTALILSLLVVVLYPYFLKKFYPEAVAPPQRSATFSAVPSRALEAEKPAVLLPVLQQSSVQPVTISNGRISMDVDEVTGAIVNIDALGSERFASGGRLRLLEGPAAASSLSFQILEGFQGAAVVEKGADFIRWTAVSSGATLGRELRIEPGKPSARLRVWLKNTGSSPQTVTYSVGTPGLMAAHDRGDARFLELLAKADGKIVRERISALSKKEGRREAPIDWVSSKSRYFSLMLKPLSAGASLRFMPRPQERSFEGRLIAPPLTAEPGRESSQEFLFYAGPTDYHALKAYGAGLEESVFTGFIGIIGWVLMEALEFFHRIVRNWGVAIILLTLAVSGILYPFTWKSLRSMKQMQALQPQLAKLKEQHKGNPEKLNKEMLELYRKHKVNPLSGCLPLLLQMPIFFALYQLLMRSIQLKGAHFLWIKDLAAPDAVWRFNHPVPLLGGSINLLPFVAIALLVAQQRFSQTAPAGDPTQKMLGWMMPIMFGFIFYGFPSGFLLYFLTSSSVMVTLQFKTLRLATVA